MTETGSRDAEASRDGEPGERKDASRGRQLVGGVVGLAVGAAVGFGATHLLPDLIDAETTAAVRGSFGAWAVPAMAVVGLLVAWLMLAVHEAGHVLGGLAARFRFLFFVAGPLRIQRSDEGGLRAGLNRQVSLYGGLAALTPTDHDRLRPRMAVFVAGGPLMSLVAGVALLWAGMAWEAPEGLVRVAMSIGGLASVGIFAVTLIPLRTGGFASDGMRLLRLASRSPSAMRESAILPLIGMMAGGVPPRDWPPDLVEGSVGELDGTPEEAMGQIFSYYHHLDRGDAARAGEAIDRAASLSGIMPKAMLPGVMVEAAYYEAFHRANADTAARHMELVPENALGLEKHERGRALAALALAEGRAGDAAALADEALRVAPPTSPFSRERLTEIQARSRAAAAGTEGPVAG